MQYYRRKVLLSIIELFGGSINPISLQKVLFLFTRKQEQGERVYDFVPYKYGCFSFQANQDIATLCKYGYLEKGQHDIQLSTTEHFSADLNIFDSQILFSIYAQFKDFSPDDFISYTYKNYPFYAINSEIASTHLTTDELKKVKQLDKRITLTNNTLFTIGYEGLSLESYLLRLLAFGVITLCDVRKNAYSQKYGFSKSQLKGACEGVGINYIHIPELGIESSQRQDLFSQKDYDILFEQYRNTVLIQNESYLNIIIEHLNKDKRVALTCFEHNPNQCHRTQIANKLMSYPNIEYNLKQL